MSATTDPTVGELSEGAVLRGILERGDIEEGLQAAAAVGDARLQQGRGAVVPESFTHGSSQQRVTWFRRGMQADGAAACDTFQRG